MVIGQPFVEVAHPVVQQGTEAATGDLVLLLDARVSVAPDALRFVSERIEHEHDLPIWSAHIDFNRESPYGRFWSVIIPLVWWRCYSEPRTTSFGLEDYDRFSKATTCFLAPRSMLLEAKREFSSYYTDTRNVSDDTGLIRLLAARQRINVSPHFACTYSGDDNGREAQARRPTRPRASRHRDRASGRERRMGRPI
jgi:hypothetical protein